MADRGRLMGLAMTLSLGACAQAPPSSPTPVPSVVPSTAVYAPTAPPSGEPSGGGLSEIDLPTPGTPWDAASLLAAMRASTRPDGVPDELQSSGLVQAIARSIWTVDGAPWDTTAIGGFCGPVTCTLEVAGSRTDRDGEDLWTLEIERGSGRIEPLVADVRSLPPNLVEELDRLVRALVPSIDDDGLALSTARWLPPPAKGGRFVLSYRSGGEEGSCRREVTVDTAAGEIVEEDVTGC